MQKYNHNYTMLCDFYELTMGNGYYVSGMKDTMTYFDLFYRTVPDQGGFAIAAGLEQAVDYIRDLHFDDEDIAYLRSRGIFDEGFLDYLRSFKFTGDVWAVPEGTPIFPGEPFLTVRAPAIEAQFIETFLLLTLNHQSLIATKTNRIVRAAAGTAVKFNARFCQRPLCAAANPAANKDINLQRLQHAGQSAVSAAVGIHHPAGDKLAVLHLVKLELLRMAKVLKDLSVFVSNRNFHHHFPPFLC